MLLYPALYVLLLIISCFSLWAIYRIRKYLSMSFPEPTVVYLNEEDRKGDKGVYFGRKIAPHTIKNVKFFVVVALCVEILFVFLAALSGVLFAEATLRQKIYFIILENVGIACCGVLPMSAFGLPPFFYTDDSEPSGFYLEGGTPVRPVSEYKELVLNP